MNYHNFYTQFKRSLLVCTVFSAFFSISALTAQAQTTTFAQFSETNLTQDFIFTNNGGASGTFTTISGGSAVDFKYAPSVSSGLDVSLRGTQVAHLTITSTTNTPATLSAGNLSQPLNLTITISIIRDTAAPVGNGTRRNLLTAVITPNTNIPQITGADGSNSATFSASTSIVSPDHNVTFTSDFLSFSATTARNLGLSFSSVTPNLSLGAGNFLNSFTAAGTGTFASNPAPVPVGPTAAAVTIGGRVLTPTGRGLRNALVTLTEAEGTTRTAWTGVNGSYSFPNLTIPQTVVVSVRSKSYRFLPRVFSPDADFNELDFTALGK